MIVLVNVHIGFGPECALLHFCATTTDEPLPILSIHLALCLEYGCGRLERFFKKIAFFICS